MCGLVEAGGREVNIRGAIAKVGRTGEVKVDPTEVG